MSETAENDFEALIEQLAVDRRVEALRKVTDLFVGDAPLYTEEHVSAFDSIMLQLAAEVETADRLELAERLAPIPNAPREMITALARDESIDVARPVLSKSPRLDPEVLLEIAATMGPKHLLAIAKRANISAAVTDMLVKRGGKDVLKQIANSDGAAISQQGIHTYAKRATLIGREKRRARRMSVSYKMWIEYGAERTVVACDVMDISATGARISTPAAAELPHEFLIYVSNKRDIARKCHVAWRNRTEVGIHFKK